MAACYHVLLLGGFFLAAMAFSTWRQSADAPETLPAFPMQLLVPVALSYLVLGEFFSFWLIAKPVRALLLVLPVAGFLGCWWWNGSGCDSRR